MIRQYNENDEFMYYNDFINLENLFELELREEPIDLFNILDNSITMLLIEKHVVGAIVGTFKKDNFHLTFDEDWPRSSMVINELKNKYDDRTIYISSIIIDPDYRNLKNCLNLFSEFINKCKEDKFTKIIYHTHKRHHYILVKRFKATTIQEEQNWYGTGETYYLGEINL